MLATLDGLAKGIKAAFVDSKNCYGLQLLQKQNYSSNKICCNDSQIKPKRKKKSYMEHKSE